MKSTVDGSIGQPIQGFSDCHVGIVGMLDELRTLGRQQDATPQRAEVAGRILQFFRDVVLVQHQEEEAELFSAVLADARPGDERLQVETMVQRLVGEHRLVEAMYAQLSSTLVAIEDGRDVALDAAATEKLAAGYLAHARFEEEVFLPLAQTILGRNSDHMAALGLALHIRHAVDELRHRFGSI